MSYIADYNTNERQIEQQLSAWGLQGLFKWLLDLKGVRLKQNYTLRWLYAVGGQSIVYLGESANKQLVIVKMALLPYHRAAYMSTEDIHKVRQHIEKEAELLKDLKGSVLPNFYDLIHDINPLLSPARGEDVVNHEPFLIMEYVQGQTLQYIIPTIHSVPSPDFAVLEWIGWQVANTTSDFCITILNSKKPLLYSDFTLSNILLTSDQNKPIRILDAGSLIPSQLDAAIIPPFTWAYVPPEFYEAYDKSRVLWPTEDYVMYTLGKVLWKILTDQRLSPGKDPALSEPLLKNYSQSLQALVSDLIERKYTHFEQMKETIELTLVKEQHSKPNLVELLSTSYGKDLEVVENISGKYTIRNEKGVYLRKVQGTKTDTVQQIRYSLDGRYIALASQQRVELWNADTLQLERRFKSRHNGSVISLDFDATGKHLVSGCDRGIICLWDINTEDSIWYEDREKGCNGLVAINAQGNLVAAATKGFVATFYPQRAIQKGPYFEGMANRGICIAMSKQQPFLAVGGLWGIRLWNTQTDLELEKGQLRAGGRMYVEQVAFGNDDRTIAAQCLDMETSHCPIMIWDLTSYKFLWRVDVPTVKLTELRLSSKGQLIFAGAPDGNVWIWDEEQKIELAQLKNCGRISSLDFASDQQRLVTATADGDICIYHLDR
jgi:WD40 repeat protein